jgi:ArsR family transcriptional regulator, arsenate/arsenite/antimonite-responsive transcriptional repressor
MHSLPVLQPICCVSDELPMPRQAAEDLAGTFKALADPTRVAIVNRLSTADSVCVCELTAAFELSQPTISHHLRNPP